VSGKKKEKRGRKDSYRAVRGKKKEKDGKKRNLEE
jgi:hypothetical protein